MAKSEFQIAGNKTLDKHMLAEIHFSFTPTTPEPRINHMLLQI